MKKEIIVDNTDLEKRLKKFCKENNIDSELFEIAIVGKGKGSGPRKELYGPNSVKNKKCTYVIKLFLAYDLIIIWNYKSNPAMSYPYLTLKEKLSRGICEGDKGRITYPNNQSKVLFENTENFERLLNIIADKK